MNNETANAQVRYTPNAYTELLRYLDRVEELQDHINDDLETMSEVLLRKPNREDELQDNVNNVLKITMNKIALLEEYLELLKTFQKQILNTQKLKKKAPM